MTPILRPRSFRTYHLTAALCAALTLLTGGAFVVGSASAVRAEDGGGSGIYEVILAGAPQRRVRSVPIPPAMPAVSAPAPARTPPLRPVIRPAAPVTAAAPVSRTVPADLKANDAKQTGRTHTVSILNDTTLRRGDVVTFPEGPKVFRGADKAPYDKVRDFEDVKRSEILPAGTRDMVVAMTSLPPRRLASLD